MPSPPSKKDSRRDSKHRTIDPALSADRAHVLSVVTENIREIPHMSKVLRCDQAFMLEVVKSRRTALMYLKKLANNRGFMLLAMQADVKVLIYLSDDLKSDKSFFKQAFFYNVNALCHSSKKVLHDFDIHKQLDKWNLDGIEKKFRTVEQRTIRDKHAALHVLKHNKNALAILGDNLKGDVDFFTEACKLNKELADNPDFMLLGVQVDVQVLSYLSDDLKSDNSFFEQAFFYNVNAIYYASKRVLHDFDIPGRLDHLRFGHLRFDDDDDDDLRFGVTEKIIRTKEQQTITDKEVALHLLKYNKNAFEILGENLKGDKDVVLAAWRNVAEGDDDNSPLLWCLPQLYENDEVVMEMLVTAPYYAGEILYMRAGESFGIEFFKEACEHNKKLMETLPKKVLSALVAHFMSV